MVNENNALPAPEKEVNNLDVLHGWLVHAKHRTIKGIVEMDIVLDTLMVKSSEFIYCSQCVDETMKNMPMRSPTHVETRSSAVFHTNVVENVCCR